MENALEFLSNMKLVESKVDDLEKVMLQGEQVNCPVHHHFGPGVYVREVMIPAGALAIGHRQKTEHLNVFIKGRVTVVEPDGSTKELKAPMIFTAPPGRKCGYIHEDVVWLNIYPTNETDIETLESTYLDKSDAWKSMQVQAASKIIDQEDYRSVLKEYGFTEETARSQSEDKSDQIPFPFGSWSLTVSDSPIEGKGLFATGNIPAHSFIAPARINGKRTPAGRYTNHSKTPNAIMSVTDNGMIFLESLVDICGCKGGQLGEEITIDYRESMKLLGVKKCPE